MLITALVVPASMKIGVLFNYVLEYNNYVTVLCENRDKPELKCNGQCHLAKELKAIEKPTDAADETTIPAQLKVELLFLGSPFQQKLIALAPATSKWFLMEEHISNSLSSSVSVPPPEYMA